MVCNHEKDNFEELHSRMLLWKRNFLFYYHLTTFSLFQMVRLLSKQLVNYFEFHKQAAWNSLPIWELIYIKFKQDLTLLPGKKMRIFNIWECWLFFSIFQNFIRGLHYLCIFCLLLYFFRNLEFGQHREWFLNLLFAWPHCSWTWAGCHFKIRHKF